MKNARIAVTIPPVEWFGGYDHRAAIVLIAELERAFETSFYPFDTTPFIFADVPAQKTAVARLRDYQPDLAISLSNAGYGLACKIDEDGNAANVFMDLLGVPLMLLWDHGLFQFPSIILQPPDDPAQSRDDAIRRVGAVINHPLAYHYPIDSGQVVEMKRIGLLDDRNVFPMPALAYKPFLDHGEGYRRSRYEQDVAFVGNVYLSDQYRNSYAQYPALAECYHRIVDDPRALTLPGWNRLAAVVEGMAPEVRAATRLDFDQSFFWSFANRVVTHGCNTRTRVELLRAIRHPVAFYGAFADPDGIPVLQNLLAGLNYKGSVDFATALPQVYGASKILVDLTNAAFINNCSPKPICCLAASGFALFDRKTDVLTALGADAERVMYRSHDDLNEKIDYFLTHDGEREELGRHFRSVIADKLQFNVAVRDACAALYERAPRSSAGRERLKRWLEARSFERPIGLPRKVVELDLSAVNVPAHWPGARILSAKPLRIETSSIAWAFSAVLPLAPAELSIEGTAPVWLEVAGRAISGRAGIALWDHEKQLIDERIVDATTGAFEIFLLLDPEVVTGLMFRASDVPSAVIEIDRITVVTDAETGEGDARERVGEDAAASPLAKLVSAVAGAIKGLRG